MIELNKLNGKEVISYEEVRENKTKKD